ncbi:MAG: MFS transporter [Thermus sp.]
MSGRLLLALMLGVFMGALDNAILAPALPAIAQDLGTGVDRITLAFSIYSVFYAVAVPILGRLSDLLGYGRVYGVSMALFAGGSALAALSQSLETLVLARVVQAVGAGGLFPVAQAIVGVVAPGGRRGGLPGADPGVSALRAVLSSGPTWGGSSWNGPRGTGCSGSTCPSGCWGFFSSPDPSFPGPKGRPGAPRTPSPGGGQLSILPAPRPSPEALARSSRQGCS